MRLCKFKASQTGVLAEASRAIYKRGNHEEVAYDCESKSAIDFSKTHLNYNLCPHPEYTNAEIILKNQFYRNRKLARNDNAFGGFIITRPANYEGDLRKFFESAYKNFKKFMKLKDEDIISAYVHMDESAEHLHIYYLIVYHPELHNDMDGKETISWEKVVPKKVYITLHNSIQAMISEDLGCPITLLNGQTLPFNVQDLNKEQKSILMRVYELKSEIKIIGDEIWKLESKTVHPADAIDRDHEINLLMGSRKKKQEKIDELLKSLNDGKNMSAHQKAIVDMVIQSEEILRHYESEYNKNISDLKSELDAVVNSGLAYIDFEMLASRLTYILNQAYVAGRDGVDANDMLNALLPKFEEELSIFKEVSKDLRREIGTIIEKNNTNSDKKRPVHKITVLENSNGYEENMDYEEEK